MNDFYQRTNPQVRYVQRDTSRVADPRGMAPSGEGVLRAESDRINPREASQAQRFRGLDLGQINRMARDLGLGTGFVVGHADSPDAREGDGTTVVRNVNDLTAALQRARQTNNFPLIIGVDVSGRIFNLPRGVTGGHVVSITGYDPVRQTVELSNQWGRESDLHRLDVRRLYNAMLPYPY